MVAATGYVVLQPRIDAKNFVNWPVHCGESRPKFPKENKQSVATGLANYRVGNPNIQPSLLSLIANTVATPFLFLTFGLDTDNFASF